MAKLCARGKAAAKRKFKVYPSAYANMYASAVCSGKVTPGGKKKKKKKKQRQIKVKNQRNKVHTQLFQKKDHIKKEDHGEIGLEVVIKNPKF